MMKREAELIFIIKHLLILLLLAYSAFWLAKLCWFILDEDDGSSVLTLPSVASSKQKQESPNVKMLSSYHLFGELLKEVQKPKDEPIVAPKTSLRLVLKGVFMSKEGGPSGAIIEELGKGAEYYSRGSSLPGSATLEEVYEDRVLLRRNGRLETLAFDEKTLDVDSQITRLEKPKPASSANQSGGEQVVNSPEQFIDEATRQLSENPEQALKSVGLNASPDGYVYQGGNPMLSGLNLKQGDVIRSVNGHLLGDIQKDKALMKSLYEEGNLEVEVMRDGASFYVNYPLR